MYKSLVDTTQLVSKSKTPMSLLIPSAKETGSLECKITSSTLCVFVLFLYLVDDRILYYLYPSSPK